MVLTREVKRQANRKRETRQAKGVLLGQRHTPTRTSGTASDSAPLPRPRRCGSKKSRKKTNKGVLENNKAQQEHMEQHRIQHRFLVYGDAAPKKIKKKNQGRTDERGSSKKQSPTGTSGTASDSATPPRRRKRGSKTNSRKKRLNTHTHTRRLMKGSLKQQRHEHLAHPSASAPPPRLRRETCCKKKEVKRNAKRQRYLYFRKWFQNHVEGNRRRPCFLLPRLASFQRSAGQRGWCQLCQDNPIHHAGIKTHAHKKNMRRRNPGTRGYPVENGYQVPTR